MYTNKFKFQAIRSFSEVFQASTDFLRQEWRPFLRALLIYAGPFILITAGISIYFQQSLGDVFFSKEFMENPLRTLGNAFYLMALAGLISNTMLYTVVYSYINVYASKGADNFTQEDVIQGIKDNFLKVLITSIVIGVLIMLGFIAFILPGIYLAVPLSLIFITRIYENLSLGEGISRVFKLIRSNWWQTFGIIIVAAFIVFFLQMGVSIPQAIYKGIRGLHSISGEGVPADDTFGMLLGVITTFFSNIAGAYTLLIIAIQYFSLREYRDEPFLNERISELYGDRQIGNEDKEQW